MSEVNESSFEFRDGVLIGGNNPPPHFKLMTNTELTLVQLTAISGGVKAGPNVKSSDDRQKENFLKWLIRSGSPGPFDPRPTWSRGGGLDPSTVDDV